LPQIGFWVFETFEFAVCGILPASQFPS